MKNNSGTVVSDEVAAAIAEHCPVVALETTLVTHGLPQPDGVRVALALEEAVRKRGAIPATIGIVVGKICVGMSQAELEKLAATKGVVKLNLSNFAAQLASGASGSTTVAATMFVADRVGIPVFATGGIGGVHRGSTESGDTSADLIALSRYQGRRGVRRRESNSRFAQDGRNAGNARRAGAGLWHR